MVRPGSLSVPRLRDAYIHPGTVEEGPAVACCANPITQAHPTRDRQFAAAFGWAHLAIVGPRDLGALPFGRTNRKSVRR